MKIFKNIFGIGMLLCVSISCDHFVEVDLPSSQLTSTAVFESYTTAEAAMVAIYAKIRDNGLLSGTAFGLSNELGCYTDELQFYGDNSNSSKAFYNNGLLPSNSDITAYWNGSYNQIYAANSVIEGVAHSSVLTQVQKDHLRGEALFVRAMLHFYLVNLYGAIPYVITTDYTQNSVVTRMSVASVYSQIKSDLESAILLLPSTDISGERVRPTAFTAHALLARVDLYNHNWAEASNEASAVLNNTDYSLEPNLDAVFLKDSPTTIWQFSPVSDGRNTDDAQTFIFSTGPPPLVALSSSLLASFTPLDQRKVHWVQSVTDGTTTWYYANKYKQNATTPTSVEYTILFRLAEQYLIRAEARAQQGDLIGAQQDLNVIRNQAGLPDTTAVTAQDIITAVLQERQLEFFTEQGHRFFDLKRSGTIDSVLSPVKMGWNATDVLFPLPQTELLVNPNLNPQNPGY